MIMMNHPWGQDEPAADVLAASTPTTHDHPESDDLAALDGHSSAPDHLTIVEDHMTSAEEESATWIPAEEATPAITPEVAAAVPVAVVTWEPIERLMGADDAQAFQDRWREVQVGFIDDPQDTVRQAGELTSEVLSSLTDTLSSSKRDLDERWHTEKDEAADTETHRQALRTYRDFINRMVNA
jgi:hypothetical protein